MTDSLRKYRDVLSYSLLGVAAVSFLAMFIALVDDGQFETRISVGVVAVVVALALATRKDDLSAQARTITLVGLGVLAVAAALTLWALIEIIGHDLLPAKAAYVLDVLAALGFVGVALFYAVVTLRDLPAPVRQPQQQWSQAQGAPWGGQQPQQGGWPAAPAQQPAQQWGQPQQGWQQPAQQTPQAQQAPQHAAPQQGWQSYGGYAAGGAAAGAAGVAGAEAAGSAWGSSGSSASSAETPAAAPEAPAEVESAEQSTAVWTPPAETPAPTWQAQEQPSAWAPAAEQPAQAPQSSWGGQESSWAREGQWGAADTAQPQGWAQEATEQPSWQPPSEYGSAWAPQAEQQSAYSQPEQPAEPQGWGASEGSWGSSRLGDATFDSADGPVSDAGSESTGDADQGENRDEGQPGPSSWWSPGNGS